MVIDLTHAALVYFVYISIYKYIAQAMRVCLLFCLVLVLVRITFRKDVYFYG